MSRTEARGDLGQPVTPLTDEAQHRRRLGRVAEVVAQQARRLVVQHPERAQDERPDGGVEIPVVGRQLPVSRDAPPDGVGLDGVRRVREPERLRDPPHRERPDPEDLGRAPVKGSAAIQREDGPSRRLLPEAVEKRGPLRIADLIEGGQQSGDLGREARPLESAFAIVPHPVDGAPRGEDLAQQPRLPAATAPVQHAERARAGGAQAPKPRRLFRSVHEREPRHPLPAQEFCRSSIM